MNYSSPRAKRQQQQKQQRRVKSLQAFVIGILCAALALTTLWAWQHLTNPKTLPFHHVTIEGKVQYTSHKTLLNTVRQHINDGFFALNSQQLKQSLLDLPWIDEVDVRRSWPDKLIIHVNEYQAMASWNAKQMISTDQQVFTPTGHHLPTGLPHLLGPDDSVDEVLAFYQAITQSLKPLQLSVKRLELSPRHNWLVTLSNGLKITLGKQQTEQRWQRFIYLYPKIIEGNSRQADSVDLRYSNGLAVHYISP